MNYRIRVIAGPDQGRTDSLPDTGASLGRSVQNDLVYNDPEMSRHHCRIHFEGDRLILSDLATLNGTSVNGTKIDGDLQLCAGDRIKVADTVLEISDANGVFVSAEQTPAPPATPEPAAEVPRIVLNAPEPAAAPIDAPPARVDLGFGNADATAPANDNGAAAPRKPQSAEAQLAQKRKVIYGVLGGVVLLLVLAAGAKSLLDANATKGKSNLEPLPAAAKSTAPLAFSYVKVEGSSESIFRYEMELAPDGRLSVSVDDLAQDRHLTKTKPEPLPEGRVAELGRLFRNARFASLPPLSEGIARANTCARYRISAVVDGRPVTVEVRDGAEPDEFASLRADLETFARNELGLWAFAFGRDKLLELAEESLANARRYVDERDVRLDNLFNAVRAFDACINYLESLEPKPEMFDEARTERERADSALRERVETLNANADISTQQKDWTSAQAALRELMDVVPDDQDKRHTDARRRLLDVERRMQKTK